MQTPITLKIHILTRITAWRLDTHWTNISETPPPLPITSQLSLGEWSHFMEGRLHVEWRLYMQHHYDTIRSRRTGSQWSSQCIQRIWTLFHISQWHRRNKFVHNQTEESRSTRKREELQHVVSVAYHAETKHNLLVRDQNLYDESLATILASSDDAMIAWLEDMRIAKRDRDESFSASTTGKATLRTWMVPKRHQADSVSNRPQKRKKTFLDSNEWNKNGKKTTLRQGSWRPP